jgi:ADP-ribosylglycohydrolase
MRAAILGASVEDPTRLQQLVLASSRLTHQDSRACDGSLLVARAARLAAGQGPLTTAGLRAAFETSSVPTDPQFRDLVSKAFQSVDAGEATELFAARHGMERGVSGFIVHTVPVALHASLSFPRDLRGAVQACIRCGGDTDTTAAIAGGIVGAGVGPAGVPSDWLANLWAWPRPVAWMQELAAAAAIAGSSGQPGKVPRYPWPMIPLRNLGFLAVVLAHGFRRLAPPY